MKKILAIAFLFSCLHVAGQEAPKVLPGFNRIRLGNRYDTGVINFLSPDTASALNIIGRLRVTDTTEHDARASYSSNLGASFTRYSLVDKNYTDSSISAHASTSSLVFVSTAVGTALTNTTSAASLAGTGIGATSVAPASLTVGKTIHVHGWFQYSTGASNTNFSFTTAGGVGGVVFALPVSQTNALAEYDLDVVIITTGSSGTMAYFGSVKLFGTTTLLAYTNTTASGLGTINTTASEDFGPLGIWGTASASNSIQSLQGLAVKVQ